MPGRNDPCPCGSGKKYKKCCAAQKDPNRVPRIADLTPALTNFENGNYPAAITSARAYLQINNNEPMAWQVLGVSLYCLGDLKPAEAAFREVIKRDKRNHDALNNLGLVLFELGQFDESERFCRKALSLQPDMPGAHNNLGNIYRSQGDFYKAEKSYKKAISLGLKSPETYCNLGTVQQEQGNAVAAEQSYHKALEIDSGFVSAISNLGALMLEKGELEKAHEQLEQAYKYNSDNSDVLCNLGKLWQERGNSGKAEEYLLQAIKLNPNDVIVNYRIGLYYQSLIDFNEARKYFLNALKINPVHVQSLISLGEIAYEQSLKSEAAEYYQKAMEYGGKKNIDLVKSYCKFLIYRQRYKEANSLWANLNKYYPGNIKVLLGMADYFKETGEFEKAEKIYNQLVDGSGTDKIVFFEWAYMEEARNNVEKAASLARKVLDIDPDHSEARVLLSKTLERSKNYTEAFDELNRIELDKYKADSYRTYHIFFQRATILDKMGNYDAAFNALARANELKSIGFDSPYDEDEDRKIFSSERKIFSSDNLISLPRYSVSEKENKPTPIFIVGFPRSGTTLMEQILGSHSMVSAGGELPFIEDLKNKIKLITGSEIEYPENIIDIEKPLDQNAIQQLHNEYISRIEDNQIVHSGTLFITDKLPHNLANLGLISLLFPDSPIIHITRHPMDACISAFMANFAHGHKYTSNMKNTVTHYALLMQAVVQYKSVLKMKYFQLRYEDLIEDIEATVNEILKYIGLPWEDSCLNFHENKRVAKTASYAQVTQKIYTSSRYRYKNYYKQLEPYADILSDAMNEFGYIFEP